MIGIIKRRTHQIVHRRINHHKVFLFAMFDEFDARQQRACITDQTTTRLKNQFQTACTHQFLNGLGIRTQIRHIFVLVNNADTAAQVQVFQHNAFGCQLVDQGQDTFAGFDKRAEVGQL